MNNNNEEMLANIKREGSVKNTSAKTGSIVALESKEVNWLNKALHGQYLNNFKVKLNDYR